MNVLAPDSGVVEPLSPVRRLIATRLADATRSIPHFRLVATINVDSLLRTYQGLRQIRPRSPLSLNDLLIKICACALRQTPALNIQWADEGIRRFADVDIAVAVAIEDGVTTPILRDASSKSVWDIASEVRLLADRARTNKLKIAEVFGGTFCISNLGMYGVEQFDAIINPPQCAILAVGAVRPQLAMDGNGAVSSTSVMTLTLSVDHRAVDGAMAATFLQVLRSLISEPDLCLAESDWEA